MRNLRAPRIVVRVMVGELSVDVPMLDAFVPVRGAVFVSVFVEMTGNGWPLRGSVHSTEIP
jgi:hypothetical protein